MNSALETTLREGTTTLRSSVKRPALAHLGQRSIDLDDHISAVCATHLADRADDGEWLFAGWTADQHVSSQGLGERLLRHGVTGAARISALHGLSRKVPSTILADLIGYNRFVVANRAHTLAEPWQNYAAVSTRRQLGQQRSPAERNNVPPTYAEQVLRNRCGVSSVKQAMRRSIITVTTLIALSACTSTGPSADSSLAGHETAVGTEGTTSTASSEAPFEEAPEAASLPSMADHSCISGPSSFTNAPITIEFIPPAECSAEISGLMRVTNSSEIECGSDIMASVGDSRVWMASTAGYGSARGTWAPMPDDVGEAVGYVAYPPGTIEWDVVLPQLPSGRYEWTFIPGMQCGAVDVLAVVDIDIDIAR